MAISDKLLTTAQSCLDIRQAIKEIDPKKGAGNITTLDDDLSLIVTRPKMMVVCKVTDNDGFHYEALMFDSDNGSFPSMTSSNANLPGPIICVLIESNSTSSPSFSGQSELKQVFFPDTISTFGSLSNCSSLTEIIIPKSTTSLSVNFQGCSSLKYVDMSSVTGSIASYIFENCTSLESVKLGVSQNQRTITGLFRDCSSLEKIYGLENFKFSAYNFINCSKLSEIHVSSIENFLKNSMLATSAGYTSPFAASSAESRGIYINNTLVTDIIVPDTITSIQTWAFNKVNTIQSVTFHNTLTKIGTEAFKGCTELTGDLVIPSSVTSIGSSAFSGCNKLTGSVIIPNCSVASNAFNGCRLTNLTMKATTMVSIAGTGDNTGTATIIGNVTSGLHNANNATTRFPHINIIGNVTLSQYQLINNSGVIKSIRISGNWTRNGGNGLTYTSAPNFEFFELGGISNGSSPLFNTTNGPKAGGIIHFGYSDIAVSISNFASSEANRNTIINRLDKIYVGDGSSQEADQAVLDLYLADEGWAAYSSKLDLWYNYDGEYKTAPTIPN